MIDLALKVLLFENRPLGLESRFLRFSAAFLIVFTPQLYLFVDYLSQVIKKGVSDLALMKHKHVDIGSLMKAHTGIKIVYNNGIELNA